MPIRQMLETAGVFQPEEIELLTRVERGLQFPIDRAKKAPPGRMERRKSQVGAYRETDDAARGSKNLFGRNETRPEPYVQLSAEFQGSNCSLITAFASS